MQGNEFKMEIDPTVAALMKQTQQSQDAMEDKSISKDTASVNDILKEKILKGKTEFVCEGKTYKIKKFNIPTWLAVTPKLGQVFAPATALMASDELDEAAMVLFSGLDDGMMNWVVETLLTCVTIDGQPVTLETFDDPYEMMAVCVEVVKVNYEKPFTKGLRGLMESMGSISQLAQTL